MVGAILTGLLYLASHYAYYVVSDLGVRKLSTKARHQYTKAIRQFDISSIRVCALAIFIHNPMLFFIK